MKFQSPLLVPFSCQNRQRGTLPKGFLTTKELDNLESLEPTCTYMHMYLHTYVCVFTHVIIWGLLTPKAPIKFLRPQGASVLINVSNTIARVTHSSGEGGLH